MTVSLKHPCSLLNVWGEEREKGKGFRGHVIVVGLAFLDGKRMTVDIDDARLWVDNESLGD